MMFPLPRMHLAPLCKSQVLAIKQFTVSTGRESQGDMSLFVDINHHSHTVTRQHHMSHQPFQNGMEWNGIWGLGQGPVMGQVRSLSTITRNDMKTIMVCFRKGYGAKRMAFTTCPCPYA